VSQLATPGLEICADSLTVAQLFAQHPIQYGGIVLRSAAGPVRDIWLSYLSKLLNQHDPLIKIPCSIHEDRLLGGIDLSASLHQGRRIEQPGVLQQVQGGVLLCAMAERLPITAAAHIAACLDRAKSARCSVILLDEGVQPDECPPAVLTERCAFHVDLTPISLGDIQALAAEKPVQLPLVSESQIARPLIETLCATASALGIVSLRPSLFALYTTHGLALMEGRSECTEEDAAMAARLVLAPLAKRLPVEESQSNQEPPAGEQTSDASDAQSQQKNDATSVSDQPLQDQVLAAASSAIPRALLASLMQAAARSKRSNTVGRAGSTQNSFVRGRPAGVRATTLRTGMRLNVLATLRAAAPWQQLRKQMNPQHPNAVQVHPQDFRVTRFIQRSPSTTVFVIDASGSSALHRLAEAKGAVELLLAQCYVRRDQVAVVAFRGQSAQLLLPPTRSLTRAKKELGGLPGGGATPLANGIDAALQVALAAQRRGAAPTIVLLTDGRANMGRDGKSGRVHAQEHALHAATQVRACAIPVVLIDTSPQPQAAAFDLAVRMGARYLPLPHADARTLSQAAALVSAQ
jgi:magnesium chelatase subunit D